MPNGRLPPLNALRAFEAAARLLSFKNAARELHVTAGAVSHHVKQLEEHLGRPLFRRLTRALELTPEGAALLPEVQNGLQSIVSALEKARVRASLQALTVISPPNFAARWLVPRLGRFTRAHPDLELLLASRASMIDGREDDPELPLPTAGADDTPVAMIRFGDGRYPGSRVDELFTAKYIPVCSPRLLAGDHPLKQPSDLRYHTLLHDHTVVEEDARPTWSDWLEGVGIRDIDATRGPQFSDASLAFEAALEGMGVALVMKPLVRSDLEEGRLVIPFDIATPAKYSYYLVTQENGGSAGALSAFREWLLEESAPERA